MSGTFSRRTVAKVLLGGAAAWSAPTWASEIEERQGADQYWARYQSGKDAKCKRHPSREAERALQAVAGPLCKVSTRTNLQWRVGLLEVDPRDINACTVGGGVIFINDALVAQCSGESDLAAVIAHEVGHVEHRHSIKGKFALRMLENDVDVRKWNNLEAEVAKGNHMDVADAVIFRSYTRQWEYQADAFSVRAMAATGFDPFQAHVFFERMRSLFPDSHDVDTCLVNTHPEFSDRISRIQALAKGYGRGPRRPDSTHFRRLADLIG